MTYKHGFLLLSVKQYFWFPSNTEQPYGAATQVVPLVLHPDKNLSHASSDVPSKSSHFLTLHAAFFQVHFFSVSVVSAASQIVLVE